MRPWAVSTKPPPTGSAETCTASAPSRCRPSTAPVTSTIASTAPTSWKCTASTVLPCTRASASASRVKIRVAVATTVAAQPTTRQDRHDIAQVTRLTAAPPGRLRRRSWSPGTPPASPPAPSASTPPPPASPAPLRSTPISTPASTSAPNTMSPDAPLGQSKYTTRPIRKPSAYAPTDGPSPRARVAAPRSEQDEARDEGAAEAYAAYAAGGPEERNEVMRRSSAALPRSWRRGG